MSPSSLAFSARMAFRPSVPSACRMTPVAPKSMSMSMSVRVKGPNLRVLRHQRLDGRAGVGAVVPRRFGVGADHLDIDFDDAVMPDRDVRVAVGRPRTDGDGGELVHDGLEVVIPGRVVFGRGGRRAVRVRRGVAPRRPFEVDDGAVLDGHALGAGVIQEDGRVRGHDPQFGVAVGGEYHAAPDREGQVVAHVVVREGRVAVGRVQAGAGGVVVVEVPVVRRPRRRGSVRAGQRGGVDAVRVRLPR